MLTEKFQIYYDAGIPMDIVIRHVIFNEQGEPVFTEKLIWQRPILENKSSAIVSNFSEIYKQFKSNGFIYYSTIDPSLGRIVEWTRTIKEINSQLLLKESNG